MAKRGGKGSGAKPQTLFERLAKRKANGSLSLALSDADVSPLPERPDWLSQTAGECWDDVTSELQRIDQLKSLDTRSLCMLCELWGLYRESVIELEQDFLNNKLADLTLKYAKGFLDVAKDFGMTPKSRSLIHHKTGKTDSSPLEEFGIKAG